MARPQPRFTTRLKEAVCADPSAPLIFVGNFEVENQWGHGEIGLPTFGFAASNLLVNRMDEFALLLAGPEDFVLLKGEPDPEYLASLASLGLELPTILVVSDPAPERTVTQDALADPSLIARLAGLGRSGAALFPHGVSEHEEHLAKSAGLTLAAPPAEICKAVNSKVYSRRLADALSMRQPPGLGCTTGTDWAEAVAWARRRITAGARVGIKDAYGVSGKGIVIVNAETQLASLDRMVTTRLRRSGSDRLGLVVEEWVPKSADLNYQFTLGRDGQVSFDFVKEAVTENGVHKGHRIPARLDTRQQAEIVQAAWQLGAALAADGYFGVVGVDAMVDPGGCLYPVIEINARNNMSTYQVRIQDEVATTGQVILARHYQVRAVGQVPFSWLRDLLGDLLITSPGGTGLLVNNFATVSAVSSQAMPGQQAVADGRLYGLVIADDASALDHIDAEIARRLTAVPIEGAAR
jgi:Pre ATP-grasp domain/ATP-grasp domain